MGLTRDGLESRQELLSKAVHAYVKLCGPSRKQVAVVAKTSIDVSPVHIGALSNNMQT